MLVIAGLLLHLVLGLSLTVIQSYLPDELLYVLMNEGLAAGSLAVQNGYDEFTSPLLEFTFTTPRDGKLYPQYPSLYPFFTLPLYLLAGKAGLVLMNQVAFVLLLWLVYRIQQLLFADATSGFFAVLMTAFGGYLWLFSQHIVPHMLQITLVLAACYVFLRSFMMRQGRWGYLLAGVLIGMAMGIRYDTIFVIPALVLPLVFASPIRLYSLSLLLPGIGAALLALSITNDIKFGVFQPFSYGGRGADGYTSLNSNHLMIAAFGFIFVLVSWSLHRLSLRGYLTKGGAWLIAIGALIVLACALMLLPWVHRLHVGIQMLVIDFSIFPLDRALPSSASRTEAGGYLYFGEFKRALLQSCPFIALIAVLALRKLTLQAGEKVAYIWLSLVPLAFIGFYALYRWHGGFGYHIRYFLPALPFLSMLCAQILTRLLAAYALLSPRDWRPSLVTGILLAISVTLYAQQSPVETREWFILAMPLWGWFVLLLAVIIGFYDGAAKSLRQLVMVVPFFMIAWGGATSFLIYYPQLNEDKLRLQNLSQTYEEVISDDALLISVPRHVTQLIGSPNRRFRLATIFTDRDPITPEHVRELIEYFLRNGTDVYLTHDLASFSILNEQFPEWGMRRIMVQKADETVGAPALSRIEFQP